MNVSSSNAGPDEGQDISLSDLLNAMNGVASSEGVILIMTTNRSEKLDNTLIWDSWVDLKVQFALSQKEKLRDLFIRMYTHEARLSPALKVSSVPFRLNMFSWNPSLKIADRATNAPEYPDIDCIGLYVMAETFAAHLLSNMFSATEIQRFLILRKTNAEDALATVTQWVNDILTAKAKQERTADCSIGSLNVDINDIQVGGT